MNKYSDGNSLSLAARDRVLAYLYQMDIEAVESLEIALKTLERPAAAGQGQVIENLLALLKERGQSQKENEWLTLAASTMLPPLNRQPMVSEGLNISIGDFFSRVITGGFRPVKNKEGE